MAAKVWQVKQVEICSLINRSLVEAQTRNVLSRFFRGLGRWLLLSVSGIITLLAVVALIQYYPQYLLIGFFVFLVAFLVYFLLKKTFG